VSVDSDQWRNTVNRSLEYSEAFRLFDRDEDSFINAKELSLLIRSLERNPSDNEIQQLIDQIVDKGSVLR
jgi:Ca2+-binding EF-hand superfamily protein